MKLDQPLCWRRCGVADAAADADATVRNDVNITRYYYLGSLSVMA